MISKNANYFYNSTLGECTLLSVFIFKYKGVTLYCTFFSIFSEIVKKEDNAAGQEDDVEQFKDNEMIESQDLKQFENNEGKVQKNSSELSCELQVNKLLWNTSHNMYLGTWLRYTIMWLKFVLGF